MTFHCLTLKPGVRRKPDVVMLFDTLLFAQVISENTAIAIPLVGTVITATWILARKLDKIDNHIKRAWTVDDQQVWKDETMKLNPALGLEMPSPYEIVQKRNGGNKE